MAGQIASITTPDNREFFFDYDKNGNLIRQTDPMNRETEYEYDSMNKLVKIITHEGRQQTFAYDTLGNMISSTDFGGKTTYYAYDYRGLMTRTWLGSGQDEDTLVEQEYDDIGQLVKVVDGKGQEINFLYNARGQIRRTSHGEYCSVGGGCDFGVIHIWNEYDAYGRLQMTRAERRDPYIELLVDPIEYEYDNTTGQLILKRFTNGAVVREIEYEYDANGRLVLLDDWAARAVNNDGHEFAYDDNGRVTTYTDFDGAELSYTYDALGRPTSMSAYEQGNNYTYAYNAAGQLATLTAPGNRQWGFQYNDAGMPTHYTWPNGMRTEYEYDGDGRLLSLIHRNGQGDPVRRGWDYTLSEAGNIMRMTDARTTSDEGWEYDYDRRDRLTHAMRRNAAGAPIFRMVYTYDAADNMTSQTRYNFTSRVFDNFDDGDYTSNPAWTVESGTWSAASNALVPTPQSGARAIYTSNSFANSDAWFSFKLTGSGGGWFDGWLVQLRYVDENNYLAVGWTFGSLYLVERVNGTETYLVTRSVVPELNVWYDIHAQLDGDAVVLYWGERGAVPRRIEQSTDMPASTNRLRVWVNGQLPWAFDDFRVMSRSLSPASPYIFTYGPANQLASMTTAGVTSNFSYDAWGRMVERSAEIGGQTYTVTYTYWWGDKLKRVDSDFPGETAVLEYYYDGLGKRRVRYKPGEDPVYWRWDTGYSVLAEYDYGGAAWTLGDMTRFFVPFGHTALAETDMDVSGNPANAAYTYLAHDHLGSGRFGYNQSKTQVSAYEHYPTGWRLSASGPAPYHEFTGKPWDPDTQLFYFPFRYYRPMIHRWNAIDPLCLVDGPNMYTYGKGNPINFYDLDGTSAISIITFCTTVSYFIYKTVSFFYDSIMSGVNIYSVSEEIANITNTTRTEIHAAECGFYNTNMWRYRRVNSWIRTISTTIRWIIKQTNKFIIKKPVPTHKIQCFKKYITIETNAPDNSTPPGNQQGLYQSHSNTGICQ